VNGDFAQAKHVATIAKNTLGDRLRIHHLGRSQSEVGRGVAGERPAHQLDPALIPHEQPARTLLTPDPKHL
jgi:hypothetical protein